MGAAEPLCPVCILVGGRGTRLGARAEEIPKPLIPVGGQPFIFHQLNLLKSQGAQRIVLCVGYLGEQFERAIGDGSSFGLDVVYSHDGPKLAGTAGAVRGALRLLGPELMVLYGDTYLRVDYRDVLRVFRESGKPGLMTVLRNEGRWDTSNSVFEDGLVVQHDKHEPTPDMEWIDYGLGALRPEAFDLVDSRFSDLSDVYSELAQRSLLAGYEAHERFYEIGTPEALSEADAFLRRLDRPFA